MCLNRMPTQMRWFAIFVLIAEDVALPEIQQYLGMLRCLANLLPAGPES